MYTMRMTNASLTHTGQVAFESRDPDLAQVPIAKGRRGAVLGTLSFPVNGSEHKDNGRLMALASLATA